MQIKAKKVGVAYLMASHMSLHLTVTNRLLPMKNLHARFVDFGRFCSFFFLSVFSLLRIPSIVFRA